MYMCVCVCVCDMGCFSPLKTSLNTQKMIRGLQT